MPRKLAWIIPLLFAGALGLALITITNAQTPIPTPTPYPYTPPYTNTPDPRLPITVTFGTWKLDPILQNAYISITFDYSGSPITPTGTYQMTLYRTDACMDAYRQTGYKTITEPLPGIMGLPSGNYYAVIDYSGDAVYRRTQTPCYGFPVNVSPDVIVDTPTVTATSPPTAVITPHNTDTPAPTFTTVRTNTPSPTSALTPTVAVTPIPIVWRATYSDTNTGRFCQYPAGWITTTSVITLSPPGSQGFVTQDWYFVAGDTCPPGEGNCHTQRTGHNTTTPITGGIPLTLTQSVWWPGINAGSTSVQVDRNMTVSGLDGKLLPNVTGGYSAGGQTLWSSQRADCPVPTAGVTPTSTLTVTPTNTATSTPTATPTNTATETNTPIPTITIQPSLMPSATPTRTETPMSTVTETPMSTVTVIPITTITVTPTNTPTLILAPTPTAITSITLHTGWNWVNAQWVMNLPISTLLAKPHVVEFTVVPGGVLILVNADTVLTP